jgi:hypothetical protein
MSRQSPTVANETSSGEGSSAVEVVHAAGEGMLTKLDRHGVTREINLVNRSA